MAEWVAYCDESERTVVRAALAAVDARGSMTFATSPDGLRRIVMQAAPGELAALVGPSGNSVSPINLAAALAADGNARCVGLAVRGVSDSLRSRAGRAGIGLVVDLGGSQQSVTDAQDDERLDGGSAARHLAVPAQPVTLSKPVQEVAAPQLVEQIIKQSTNRLEKSAEPQPRAQTPTTQLSFPSSSQKETQNKRGVIITFCSGRGGVGKTSIVATAAAHATAWGLRTCVLDLDLSQGNLFSMLGLARGVDPTSLLSAFEQGGDVQLPLPRQNPVVVGPCARPEDAELISPVISRLLDTVATSFDVILIDTSTTPTDAVAAGMQAADRLIITAVGTARAQAGLARMAGLAVRLGVARTRIARLQNRADPKKRMDFELARAEVGLEAARPFRTFDGGDEVHALLASGRALELATSGSDFSESVAVVLAQLLEELGRLPEVEAAHAAAKGLEQRTHRGLLSRLREAR